jgi:hypothetical protein
LCYTQDFDFQLVADDEDGGDEAEDADDDEFGDFEDDVEGEEDPEPEEDDDAGGAAVDDVPDDEGSDLMGCQYVVSFIRDRISAYHGDDRSQYPQQELCAPS